MATTNKSRNRFLSADGNTMLTVQSREGKRGFNVAVTMKVKGEKAKTGCRTVFVTQADADKAFQALSVDALARGWVAHVAAKKSSVGAFAEIPTAPTNATTTKAKR